MGSLPTHDLIVGDFGRRATLRYLAAFSDAERRILEQRLAGQPFFDEYRTVRYTVLGLLPDLKAEELATYARAGRALDSGILVGVGGGLTAAEMGRRISEALAPWIETIRGTAVARVRVIIPCNSLCEAGKVLRNAVATGPGNVPPGEESPPHDRPAGEPPIEVFTVPEVVTAVLARDPPPYLALFATPAAFRAYEKEFASRDLATRLRLSRRSREDVSLERLMAAVRGRKPGARPAATGDLLCACTDVQIPGALDALEIFASFLARDAYCEAALAGSAPTPFPGEAAASDLGR
ncbi:MAG: hypothetical protein OES32_00780 [Acidobacteriota bacterium]|nr:hypothetical protein [Acidobacteriota bacterium]MDH3522094.1 hypothetical protein [Acidobacteriota bacterium]